MPVGADDRCVTLRETTDTEPYGYYETLREVGDVTYDESMDAWLVTSFDNCRRVLSDEDAFRQPYLDLAGDVLVELEGGPRNIIFLKGDDRERVHRWMLRAFSGRAAVDAWRATVIRPVVDSLIDRFDGRGHADLSAELAEPLPIRAIGGALGLPWQDDTFIDECKSCFDVMIGFVERHDFGDPAAAERALTASRRADELLLPFIRERRNGTGNDLISQLWHDGPGLMDGWDETDVSAQARGAFYAGTDTSRHAIATAIHYMLTQPQIMERLRTGGDKAIAAYTEEIFRMFGVIHFRPRIANDTLTLSGQKIEQDDAVLAVSSAAGRDPRRYVCPAEIDLDRTRLYDHLAFGYGGRMCIGAGLARAEVQEAIAAVLDRLPRLRLDETAEPPRYRGFMLRSFRPLNVTF
jgi:cytochrome P450